MIKTKILLENYSVNTQCKPSHGFSILIEFNKKNILLDVGGDNNFPKNAVAMNVDLIDVDYLFLSHNHIDHTGGINKFLELNKTASVHLLDNIDNKYYIKLFFLKIPIGLKLNKKYRERITQLENDITLENKIHFFRNITSDFRKPTFNNKLFKKEGNKTVRDTFEHEGILVLEDGNELLIFNSCTHNGILNVIETVKAKLPNKKIRCFVGGLHLFNPTTKKNESNEYLDYLLKELENIDFIVYTGHCTGKYALNYMKEKLGDKIQEINTGMELYI